MDNFLFHNVGHQKFDRLEYEDCEVKSEPRAPLFCRKLTNLLLAKTWDPNQTDFLIANIWMR